MGSDISRLPFSHQLLGLRRLAGSLGCEGLLAANSNLDLLGLGLSLLGEVDLQHALVIVGATCPGSTELGSVNERVKLPYCRSTRR